MAGELKPGGQDAVEKLLAEAKQATAQAADPNNADRDASSREPQKQPSKADDRAAMGADHSSGERFAGGLPGDTRLAGAEIESLLRQAERALESAQDPSGGVPAGISPFQLEDFVGAAPNEERATLEMIRDVELDLRIEFGRTHMYLEDVLKLRKGSVVALDKLAGDPVDIFVNGRLIARGEVLVLNDNFCVRVGELVAVEPSKAGWQDSGVPRRREA